VLRKSVVDVAHKGVVKLQKSLHSLDEPSHSPSCFRVNPLPRYRDPDCKHEQPKVEPRAPPSDIETVIFEFVLKRNVRRGINLR
jgi:hypothetical protein